MYTFGSRAKEVSERIQKKKTKLKDIKEINDKLMNHANLLESRCLVWPRGKGIQWNPQDDLLVSGQILLEGKNDSDSYHVTGEMYKVGKTKRN